MDGVKEIELEEDIFGHHHLLLVKALWVPEVLIEREAVGILDAEALELIVIPHLVGGSHLVGADGDGLAVDLDGSDGVYQSVELQEVLWGRFDFDTGFRHKRVINFLLLVLFLRRRFLLGFFLLGLDEDLIRLTDEHASEFVHIILILGLHFRELGEVEVSTAAPVEGF